MNNNIHDHYSMIDKELLFNMCKNTNLKNLIYLSINDVSNDNDKWWIKNKNKLIKECEQIKKKEIQLSFKNLVKLNYDNNHTKHIFKTLENKIDNIDNIINTINYIDNTNNETDNIINLRKIKSKRNYSSKNNNLYLECYSNC